MECTQEQFEKDLKESLLALGYREDCFTNWQDSNILTNNLNNKLGFISNINRMAKEKKDRYFIDHYNPELFLALAAMTEGKDWVVGEYVIVITTDLNSLGTIFKVNFLKSANSYLGYACNSHKNIYRKATKKELIVHFTKSKEKTMEKKIIGYRLIKPEYTEAALKIEGNFWISHGIRTGQILYSGRKESVEKLKNAGVLDLWFEPVYEEEKKEKEFLLRCNFTSSFTLLVTKDGFYYRPDNKTLDPVIIQNMILNVSQQYNGYEFTSFISHLDMGCKKMVPVEDIKPLIEYWEELNK